MTEDELRKELDHALLVHKDTMKVVSGEKAEYSYPEDERRKARQIILLLGGDSEVIQ
jgi:hypothetical protein